MVGSLRAILVCPACHGAPRALASPAHIRSSAGARRPRPTTTLDDGAGRTVAALEEEAHP